LDAHGGEALAVAQAADQAADGIEDVKHRLNDLKSQANSLHMQIDELSNTVRPGPDFRGDAKAAQDAVSRLQPQLDKIVGEANRVDDGWRTRSTWPAARSRYRRTSDRPSEPTG
jgi:outer membrane murein-binding lipoprotein Lpp